MAVLSLLNCAVLIYYVSQVLQPLTLAYAPQSAFNIHFWLLCDTQYF